MSVFLNQQLNVGNVSIAQRKLTPIGCDFPMGQTLIQDIANEISQVEAGYSDQALTDAGKIESCQTAIEHFNARWRQAENQKNFWRGKARLCASKPIWYRCKNNSATCNKSQNTLDGDEQESLAIMQKYGTALGRVRTHLSVLQAEFEQDINNQQQIANTNNLIAQVNDNIAEAEQTIIETKREELGFNLERFGIPIALIVLAFLLVFKK